MIWNPPYVQPKKGQKGDEGQYGTIRIPLHRQKHPSKMTFFANETGGTNLQVSPAQLNARESTSKEPGLKNFE